MLHGLLAEQAGSRASTGDAPRRTRAAVASTALASLLLGPARDARVLGASGIAVYLSLDAVADEPTVIAVLGGNAVRLPLALVVTGRVPEVDARGRVSVGCGAVTFGALEIRATRWFDPRPRLDDAFQPGRIDAAGRLLAALPSEASGVPGVPVDAIAAGLVGGDAAPALAVIGRGPGLTPAADDVIAGALSAIALSGRLHRGTADAVLARAATATTALSSSLLRCAAVGQVVPQAARLLAALCGAAPLDPALDGLRAVGGTSGTALALGIVAGARAVQSTPMEAAL